jgi:serralysin
MVFVTRHPPLKEASATTFRVTSGGLWVTPAYVVLGTSLPLSIGSSEQTELDLGVRIVGVSETHDVAFLQSAPVRGPGLPVGATSGLHAGQRLTAAAVVGTAEPTTVIGVRTGRSGFEIDLDPGPAGSGRPLLDRDGRVVGMFVAVDGSLGLAVSAEAILFAMAEIVDPEIYEPATILPADRLLYRTLAAMARSAGAYGRAERFDEVARRAEGQDSTNHDTPKLPFEVRELVRRFAAVSDIPDRRLRVQRRAVLLDECRDIVARHGVDPTWEAAKLALLRSSAPEERIVGIALLQVDPDPASIPMLATFVDPDRAPAHIGYEALVALRNAAEMLPDSSLDLIGRAVEIAAGHLVGLDRTDRAGALRPIRKILDDRAAAAASHDGTSGDYIPTVWKLWRDRSVLRVRFLGGNAAQQTEIRALAVEWTWGTGLAFSFLPPDSTEAAEIRIAVTTGQASWSYIGTDALTVAAEQPTISLDVQLPIEGRSRGKVLKELGHALGLLAEHQQPNADLPWDRAAALAVYMGSPHHWTSDQVEHDLLGRYVVPIPPAYRPFDPYSVMLLPFGSELFSRDFPIGTNTELSTSDRAFISELYPPTADPPDAVAELSTPLRS